MHPNQQTVERFYQAFAQLDADTMAACYAPDVVFENYTSDQLTASAQGIEEFRTLAEQSRGLFAEREQQLTALREWPERAVAGIAFRGVLAADIPGGPQAGSVIELDGKSEFEFRDGCITRIVDRS